MRLLLGTTDESLAALVADSLRRFHHGIHRVRDGLSALEALVREPFDLALLDHDLSPTTAPDLIRRMRKIASVVIPPCIVFVRTEGQRLELESAALTRVETVAVPVPPRVLVDRVIRILGDHVNVACLGGGTGLFTLLRGLKTVPGLGLTAIVSMSDDGGSTGRLRDEFGVLPPGDVRRSLVALSSAPDLLNELMGYRFERGGELAGHNLGNLILTALSEMRGSMTGAVQALGEILGIHGEVVPVTEAPTTLKAELDDGEVIEGENRIDRFDAQGGRRRIRRLWCDPPVAASADALRAIEQADVIVLGPGDLFTSVIANLVVDGVAPAVATSGAERVYVTTVITEGFSVADHVREIVRYLRGDCLDHVLASTTAFSEECLARYREQGQRPVAEREDEPLDTVTQARIHRADVASDTVLVRHDSMKLARAFQPILETIAAPRRLSTNPDA